MNRRLLLQSVLGHLALLEEKYPKKAASPVARRAKRYIQPRELSRFCTGPPRLDRLQFRRMTDLYVFGKLPGESAAI